MTQTLKDYRVIFDDGSSIIMALAYNAKEARKRANKYLTDICGFSGRHAGPRPKIERIEKLS